LKRILIYELGEKPQQHSFSTVSRLAYARFLAEEKRAQCLVIRRIAAESFNTVVTSNTHAIQRCETGWLREVGVYAEAKVRRHEKQFSRACKTTWWGSKGI